jgi:hypothetical protein
MVKGGREKGKGGRESLPPHPFSSPYFFMYITSLTSFTVLGTSGRYAATRLGA